MYVYIHVGLTQANPLHPAWPLPLFTPNLNPFLHRCSATTWTFSPGARASPPARATTTRHDGCRLGSNGGVTEQYEHTHMHTHTHTHTPTHPHPHTRTHTHAHPHTHTPTHAHTHTRAHSHARILARTQVPCAPEWFDFRASYHPNDETCIVKTCSGTWAKRIYPSLLISSCRAPSRPILICKGIRTRLRFIIIRYTIVTWPECNACRCVTSCTEIFYLRCESTYLGEKCQVISHS